MRFRFTRNGKNGGGILALFLTNESGQSLAEYALIATLVVVASVVSLRSLGDITSAKLENVESGIGLQAVAAPDSGAGQTSEHVHSFDYANPTWSDWTGNMTTGVGMQANVTYFCACGESETEVATQNSSMTISTTGSGGHIITYHVLDSHGNEGLYEEEYLPRQPAPYPGMW